MTKTAAGLIAVFLSAPAQAAPMRLLDAAFAGQLCRAWNDSSLPKNLGRSGSGWIDSSDSKGRQILVVSRRDCSGWTPVQLVIEADEKGQARCVSGDAYKSGKVQWRFAPTTEQWADFADGFGMLDMPGIMPGFEGSYTTAANNMGAFEVFFAAAGKVALDGGVDWTCKGADAEDVAEEVAEIDRAAMAKILAR